MNFLTRKPYLSGMMSNNRRKHYEGARLKIASTYHAVHIFFASL